MAELATGMLHLRNIVKKDVHHVPKVVRTWGQTTHCSCELLSRRTQEPKTQSNSSAAPMRMLSLFFLRLFADSPLLL